MVGGLYMIYLAIFCGFLGFRWTKHIQMLKISCSIYHPGLVKTVTDIEMKFGICCGGFSIYQGRGVNVESRFGVIMQYRSLLYAKLWWYRICLFEVTPRVTCISTTTGHLRASLWLTGCVIQYVLHVLIRAVFCEIWAKYHLFDSISLYEVCNSMFCSEALIVIWQY